MVATQSLSRTFSACLCEHFCFFSSSLDLLPQILGGQCQNKKQLQPIVHLQKFPLFFVQRHCYSGKDLPNYVSIFWQVEHWVANGPLPFCETCFWNLWEKAPSSGTQTQCSENAWRNLFPFPFQTQQGCSTKEPFCDSFPKMPYPEATQHFFQLVSTCLSSVCQRKTLTLKSAHIHKQKTQLAQTKQTNFFCYKCIPQTFAKPRPKPPVVQDQNLVQHSSQSLVLSAEVSLKLLGLLWVATTAVQHLLCCSCWLQQRQTSQVIPVHLDFLLQLSNCLKAFGFLWLQHRTGAKFELCCQIIPLGQILFQGTWDGAKDVWLCRQYGDKKRNIFFLGS